MTSPMGRVQYAIVRSTRHCYDREMPAQARAHLEDAVECMSRELGKEPVALEFGWIPSKTPDDAHDPLGSPTAHALVKVFYEVPQAQLDEERDATIAREGWEPYDTFDWRSLDGESQRRVELADFHFHNKPVRYARVMRST